MTHAGSGAPQNLGERRGNSMNDTSRLRKHYASLSDEDLSRSVNHGRSGYSSAEIWQVVKEAAAARGLAVPDDADSPDHIVPPMTPRLFDQQPSLATGCLGIAKLLLIAVAGINVVALVVVVSSSGFGQTPPLLLSNLVVLAIGWLVVSSLYSRALRRVSARQTATLDGDAAKLVLNVSTDPAAQTPIDSDTTKPAPSAAARPREQTLRGTAHRDPPSAGGPVFYPNGPQWVIIWLTTIIALALWISGTYNYASQTSREVIGVVVVGALLVWQFAKPNRR